MEPMQRIALGAARHGGNLITRAFRDIDLIKIEEKQASDYVTEVDRTVEREVIKEIRASYPHHTFIGEEFGKQEGKDPSVEWIIDPLDGTTNFIRGIPHFAVSIACRIHGKIEHAAIYDPIKNEEFTATRGRGAHLNGRRIRASNRPSLTGALLGTGIPYNGLSLDKVEPYLQSMQEILQKKTAGIRRAGAASLDLAYVAAGRLDGFWEMNLQLWDIAAGILIAKEAGAMVSDLKGSEDYLENGDVLCAPMRIYRELLPIVSRHIRST